MIPDKILNCIVKITVNQIYYDFSIPFNTSNQSVSLGTGFFIDEHHLITAFHVIEDKSICFASLPKFGKKLFDLEFVSAYPFFDIAVMKIKKYRSPYYLEIGDSDKLQLGQTIYALGYPHNSNMPLASLGTISGFRNGNIQIDAAINPGNSGGPLINNRFQVIGINISGFMGAQNENFSMPIHQFKLVQDLLLDGKERIIERPSIGIITQKLTMDGKKSEKNPKNKVGIRIVKLAKRSPLREFGVRRGDIVLSINNYEIDTFSQVNVPWSNSKVHYSSLLNRTHPHKHLNISIYSIRQKIVKSVRVAVRNHNEIYRVATYYPTFRPVPYFFVGSMILMTLTINHIFMPQYKDLDYLIDNHKLEHSKVIITHIYHEHQDLMYNIVDEGQLVSKINNQRIRTIRDVKKAILQPMGKPGKQYYQIENSLGNIFKMKLSELIKVDKKLIQRYGIPIDNSWIKMANKFSPKNTKIKKQKK